MFKRERRYSPEEFERRGAELYENTIRPLVEEGNLGRLCCIDIESGAYALGDEGHVVAQVLIEKDPDAQIWCKRIGYVASTGHGCRPEREKK
jgi:hypothetical protein